MTERVSNLTGETPKPGASANKVAEYLDRSSGQTWTGIYLELFGLALLVVFAGRMWATLREAEGAGGWIATTGFGAAPCRSDRASTRRRLHHRLRHTPDGAPTPRLGPGRGVSSSPFESYFRFFCLAIAPAKRSAVMNM